MALNGANWRGKKEGMFFSGNSFQNSSISWTKHFCHSAGNRKLHCSRVWLSCISSPPKPHSAASPFLFRPYQYNNCNVPIKQLRQGPDIVRGLRSDASSIAKALLSYWGPQMKGKSVTQWSPAAPFSSAPIYTFWKHQSRSVAELNHREKDTEGLGGGIQKPFLTSNWLSGGPVQLSWTWIMYDFEGGGVLGLICFPNFKMHYI